MIEPHLRGEQVLKDITVEDAFKKFLTTKRTDIPARTDIGGESDSVTAFRERNGRKADDEQEQPGSALPSGFLWEATNRQVVYWCSWQSGHRHPNHRSAPSKQQGCICQRINGNS